MRNTPYQEQEFNSRLHKNMETFREVDLSLRDYFCYWDNVMEKEVELLETAIKSAKNENDIQSFLKENPKFLIQHLGGGHGRWVVPKLKLGNQFETDFLIGESHSLGFEWEVVELESPKVKMFTKNGNPTKELTHAYRQISDWRNWISNNKDYATRLKSQGGLGLPFIDTDLTGLILIGRRQDIDASTNQLRRRIIYDWNIEIHPYEWLVDNAKGRVLALAESRRVK